MSTIIKAGLIALGILAGVSAANATHYADHSDFWSDFRDSGS